MHIRGFESFWECIEPEGYQCDVHDEKNQIEEEEYVADGLKAVESKGHCDGV